MPGILYDLRTGEILAATQGDPAAVWPSPTAGQATAKMSLDALVPGRRQYTDGSVIHARPVADRIDDEVLVDAMVKVLATLYDNLRRPDPQNAEPLDAMAIRGMLKANLPAAIEPIR